MSGGFFRGTSADQDTRFSNKQAKLLKSQKFAPELEHLVDMTKVKLDVIRPWIATRVTELLGFEDEVLINFIYSLLDGKEVNGKEVQISLTGFMEKNTGKFMKELWMLLLSAQKNASGVPQQFLDAKEEETRKKKMDADRIASEIQKKEKEGRELDQERLKKMDGAVEIKGTNAALDSSSKTMLAKDSSIQSEDEKGRSERNGVRGRNRGSPTQSISKSHSNSRCYSDDKHKSGSASTSPEMRRRSISSNRVRHSSRRRSITPHRRHSPQISRSPSRRRSSYSRRRSRSCSLHRSPSPIRRKLPPAFQRSSRSPMHRRSPSPIRHHRSPLPARRRRSPSPVGHRRSPSPMHRRSPSPVRRRRSPSPARRRRSPSLARRRRSPSLARHRRSPSPVRHRRSPSLVRRRRSPSPFRHRRSPSPVRHRRSPSPIRRRRSRSPVRRRRSPSPVRRRRSPSPIRRRRSPSPLWSGSPSPMRRRSPSPMQRRSPSPMRRRSPSPIRRRYQKSSLTPRHRSSSPIGQRSPVPAHLRPPTPSRRRSPPYESGSPSPTGHRSPSLVRISPSSRSKSPVQSTVERTRTLEKLSPAARRSSSSLRSPKRGPKDRNDLRDRKSAFSPSPERFPTVSESPPHRTRRSSSEDRRSFSPYVSPARQTRNTTIHDGNSSLHEPREWKTHQDGQETSKEDKETNCSWEDADYKSVSSCRRSVHSSTVNKQKESRDQVSNREVYSPKRRVSDRHVRESRSHNDKMDSRKNNQELKSEKVSGRDVHPATFDRQRSPTFYKDSSPGGRLPPSYPGESKKSDERNLSRSNNGKDSDRHRKSENAAMAVDKVDNNNHSDTVDSGSGESYKHRTENKEKRKHKKYEREEVASDNDYSNDSEIERKQAKRRRKEEKKLRKEEKRQRRDERRRRRQERRAEKLKLKNHNDADASDDENVSRRASYLSDNEVTESEQKKLEIELRNKALESIKAKKNSSH